MTNWFAGIGQATSGIQAARYGLSVVGQNMTNAATTGYTEQTVQQSAVAGNPIGGLRSGSGGLDGVTVTGTLRSTDAVLDARVRSEDARASLASTSADQLSSVVTALGEPSTTGLSATLNNFWSQWGTLADSNAAGSGARSTMLADAGAVASTLNAIGQNLADVTTSTAQSLTSDVAAVNTAAGQLATLNGSITIGTATGANVNSLLDQRDQVLDSLSKLTGGTISIDPSGAATVTVGGQTLVSGTTAATLSADGSYNLTVGGQAVTVASGSIGAETTALTSTLPGYQSSLDAVADAVSTTVNTALASGVDADGNAGTPMFAGSGALGIHVVMTDPNAIAASSSGGSTDGSVARTLSQSATAPGSADSLFTSLVGTTASASSAASQLSTTQAAVVSSVGAMKTSMSGVSVDDEAAQMLVYQQAFNASARVLTTMNDMLGTLLDAVGS